VFCLCFVCFSVTFSFLASWLRVERRCLFYEASNWLGSVFVTRIALDSTEIQTCFVLGCRRSTNRAVALRLHVSNESRTDTTTFLYSILLYTLYFMLLTLATPRFPSLLIALFNSPTHLTLSLTLLNSALLLPLSLSLSLSRHGVSVYNNFCVF
jgi:hypothetical protein